MKSTNIIQVVKLIACLMLAVMMIGLAVSALGAVSDNGTTGGGTITGGTTTGGTTTGGTKIPDNGCKHMSVKQVVTSDDTTHTFKTVCVDCNEIMGKPVTQPHTFGSDGKCTRAGCGKGCKHVDADGNNTVKQMVTPSTDEIHTISMKCTQCGFVESARQVAHEYDGTSVYCTVCERLCPHKTFNRDTGKCTQCGYTCKHEWTHTEANTICALCSKTCSHGAFLEGTIKTENNDTEHYLVGTCSICKNPNARTSGTPHTLSSETGKCTGCDFTCNHSFELRDSYYDSVSDVKHAQITVCTRCNMQLSAPESDHIFSDGVCTVCGYGCTHTFNDGVCTKCNFACEHGDVVMQQPPASVRYYNEYTHEVDYSCKTCGKTVTRTERHVFDAGICTVCDTACGHPYLTKPDQKCDICGIQCQHATTAIKYTVNDYYGHIAITYCPTCTKTISTAETESHTYSKDGTTAICTKCNFKCYHNWDNGHCDYCAVVCSHAEGADDSGYCKICRKKIQTTS